MEVKVLSELPLEWQTKKPIESYDTRLLYVGYSRYDVVKQVLSSFYRDDSGKITYNERPQKEACFSRCYATEHVHITIYSHSPRVWKEDSYFFVQQPTQEA